MIIREIGWVGETERNVILWDLHEALERTCPDEVTVPSCLR